jgi:hypothetical protein
VPSEPGPQQRPEIMENPARALFAPSARLLLPAPVPGVDIEV